MGQFPLFRFADARAPGLFFIAGPCVIESEEICKKIAGRLSEISSRHHADIVFKASFDKANRLSGASFRGPGKEAGLRILETIKREFGLPVLTDIHEAAQAAEAAAVVDVLQIPALLCRQTDLIAAAASTGKWVNIKKGQFMAPEDMEFAVAKAGENVWITERGTCFGYKRLVVDFAGIPVMKKCGKPLIFDATHSVQLPGGGKGVSSGNRDLALPLAGAALAMGVDGLFFEVHPEPEKALCDGPNSLRLDEFAAQVPRLQELFRICRSRS